MWLEMDMLFGFGSLKLVLIGPILATFGPLILALFPALLGGERIFETESGNSRENVGATDRAAVGPEIETFLFIHKELGVVELEFETSFTEDGLMGGVDLIKGLVSANGFLIGCLFA